MRKASIHITKECLVSILAHIYEEDEKRYKLKDLEELAHRITRKAKDFSLNHRVVIISNDKLKRDSKKMVASTRGNTAVFSELLIMIRRQLKHRNLELPKAGTKEFLELKEITKKATDFCKEFDFDIKEGYKKYITLHLKNMKGKFRLSLFKFNHGKIIDLYDAQRYIDSDPYAELTEEAHRVYVHIIAENTGICEGFREMPEQYKFFCEISALCKKYKQTPETWVKAQFEGFEWVKAVPEPSWMVGEKAIKRVQKYCYKNGIKPIESENPKTLNLSKLKNAK